jgi:hypothetical protein
MDWTIERIIKEKFPSFDMIKYYFCFRRCMNDENEVNLADRHVDQVKMNKARR